MKRKYLFTSLYLVGLFNFCFSQNAEITSWMRNVDGDLANYEFYDGPPNNGSTPVQLTDSSDIKSVCYNDNDVYINANGLASYTMGPFLMNPNEPSNQNYTIKFTRTPFEETGTKTEIPLMGGIGFAINGVILYGYGDAKSYSKKDDANVSNGDGIWDTDAWIAEGETMDVTGAGHADDRGYYHYHATPIALYSDPSVEHSPIIGYALDGFPIYGPFGYSSAQDPNSSITRMQSGYELRNITERRTLPDGSESRPPGPNISTTFPLGTYIQDYEYTNNGDLDQYNGRFCVTPEYPDGTYAYFLSTDNAGQPAFPYILAGEYYGVVSQNDIASVGKSTTPSGLDCYTGGTITGVKDEIVANINIFPNPATDKVIVNTQDVADLISIIDINGKTIEFHTPSTTSTEINTSVYSQGLYFVKIEVGTQSKTISLQIVK
ncbi:MAG: YHYH protein [Cytophagales bacterium]|nr:YHYH protein [Cytophagales bacterium]